MTRHLAFAAFVSMSLSACAVIPDAPNVEGTPFAEGTPVRLGQPVRVGEVVVTPKAVVEDSRCPVDTQCVWAGRLIVRTRIDGAGWRDTANISLGETYATHGHGIVLASATPKSSDADEAYVEEITFVYEKMVVSLGRTGSTALRLP